MIIPVFIPMRSVGGGFSISSEEFLKLMAALFGIIWFCMFMGFCYMTYINHVAPLPAWYDGQHERIKLSPYVKLEYAQALSNGHISLTELRNLGVLHGERRVEERKLADSERHKRFIAKRLDRYHKLPYFDELKLKIDLIMQDGFINNAEMSMFLELKNGLREKYRLN